MSVRWLELTRIKGISICLRGRSIRMRLRSSRQDMPRVRKFSVLWIIWPKRPIRIWRHFISLLCFLCRPLGVMLWTCFKRQFLSSIRFLRISLWNLKLLKNWKPESRKTSCLKRLNSKPYLDWALNRKMESKIWRQFSNPDSKIPAKISLYKSQSLQLLNTWSKL